MKRAITILKVVSQRDQWRSNSIFWLSAPLRLRKITHCYAIAAKAHLASSLTQARLSMKLIVKSLLVTFALTGNAGANDIPLKGTVLSSTSQIPIKGAVVYLHKGGEIAVSDYQGRFDFNSVSAINTLIGNSKRTNLHVRNNVLFFCIERNATPVTIKLFDCRGRKIGSTIKEMFHEGSHHLNLSVNNRHSSQVYVIQFEAGNRKECIKYVPHMCSGTSIFSAVNKGKQEFSQYSRLHIADTLTVTAYGYQKATQEIDNYTTPLIIKLTTDNTTPAIPPGMKAIPGGVFDMGGKHNSNETPIHPVKISPFFMDSIEVTQADYVSLLRVKPWFDYKKNKPGGIANNHPVWFITWNDAVLYCNARSKRDGLDTVYTYSSLNGIAGNGCTLSVVMTNWSANGYRMPTEAEWEYAARAGTQTDFYWGDETDNATVGKYAWFMENSGNTTHPGAQKRPNNFGLYDMCGNIREFTNDYYNADYYLVSDTLDPKGPGIGDTIKVIRGGNWLNSYTLLRLSRRIGVSPYFRDAAQHGNSIRCVKNYENER